MPAPIVTPYPAGTQPYVFQPGDIFFVRGDDLFCRAIHLGQRLRFRGRDRGYAAWNHVGIIIDDLGHTVEAFSSGVTTGDLHHYLEVYYKVVDVKMSPEDREQAVNFAERSLNEGYGWFTIVSICLSLLTGTRFSFGFDGEEVCSGLVARALERGWSVFPRDASHLVPADLAKFFGVLP